MERKSRGTYVLVFGLVVLVGGITLTILPGPGILVLALGVVIAAIGVVVLLSERNAAKIAAMDPTTGPAQPPR